MWRDSDAIMSFLNGEPVVWKIVRRIDNARIVMRWFLNMAERSRLRQNMRPQHAYRRALTTEKRTVLFAPAKLVNEITGRFYN